MTPWLVLAIAVAFFVLGLPADRPARDAFPRAGLAWGCLTFVAPGAVWIGIALGFTADRAGDSWTFVTFVGLLASFAAVLVGTLVARRLRKTRSVG